MEYESRYVWQFYVEHVYFRKYAIWQMSNGKRGKQIVSIDVAGV